MVEPIIVRSTATDPICGGMCGIVQHDCRLGQRTDVDSNSINFTRLSNAKCKIYEAYKKIRRRVGLYTLIFLIIIATSIISALVFLPEMHQLESFFVELPSNSDSKPDNTVSNYVTRLNRHLALDDNYEVAIAEIDFTYSWYTIPTISTIRTVEIANGSYIPVKRNTIVDTMSLFNKAALGLISQDKYINDQSIREYTKEELACKEAYNKASEELKKARENKDKFVAETERLVRKDLEPKLEKLKRDYAIRLERLTQQLQSAESTKNHAIVQRQTRLSNEHEKFKSEAEKKRDELIKNADERTQKAKDVYSAAETNMLKATDDLNQYKGDNVAEKRRLSERIYHTNHTFLKNSDELNKSVEEGRKDRERAFNEYRESLESFRKKSERDVLKLIQDVEKQFTRRTTRILSEKLQAEELLEAEKSAFKKRVEDAKEMAAKSADFKIRNALAEFQRASVCVPSEGTRMFMSKDDLNTTLVLEPAFFADAETLVAEVNKYLALFAVDEVPELFYDKLIRKVGIKPGFKDGVHVWPVFSIDLQNVLGIEAINPDKAIALSLMGKRPVDLSGGISALYVYCDIVGEQYVGNTMSKLLRVVEIPGSAAYGQQVTVRYAQPHYVPLAFRQFETIEIHIKDDNNRDIPFEFGRSRVKLHFRRRKHD